MNKRLAVIPASLGLALNLLRFNLSGAFDTYYIFLLLDAVSWSLAALTLFIATDNLVLKNIFLFTFVLTLNSISNAAGLRVTYTDYTEYIFLATAFLVVITYTVCSLKKTKPTKNQNPPE